jgi:hypothetical protein
MCGNSKRRHRWRIENVARETQLLLRRIVMIPEKIVRLDNINIVNLRGLQNFSRAFRAGDIGTRSYLAPPPKGVRDANLRPNTDDCRNNKVEQPVLTAESVWV